LRDDHGMVIEKALPCWAVLGIIPFGGAEGIRTPYLLNANQAFSRVNYGPINADHI
jgi:hypothetical protein